MRGAIQRLCLATGCVFLLAAAGDATPSFAAAPAAPWWHLTPGAAPTSVQPGTGKDEVQKLTVATTEASYVLVRIEHQKLLGFAGVSATATHEELQEALEGMYGVGNVEVTGGPGNATGSDPYEITYTGELADQPIEPATPLIPGVEVAEVTKGQPDGKLLITASNLGDTDASGASTPMRIADKLPPGLKAVAIEGFTEGLADAEHIPWECSLSTLSCSSEGTLAPYGRVEMYVSVVDVGAKPGAIQEATVSGGGALSVSASRPVAVGDEPTQFGVESYELMAEEDDGTLDTQAGSHPFQLTSILSLNHAANLNSPPALPKDLSFKLPPGLIGNPTAYPQCTELDFLERASNAKTDRCPAATAIGVATVTIVEPAHFGLAMLSVPLFNLVPQVGEPARFGFMAEGVPTILDTSVRTGGDYGVTVTTKNVPETIAFLADAVTFWGVPGAASHDNARGWGCVSEERWARNYPGSVASCSAPATHPTTPFLTMPTSCPANTTTSRPEPMQTSVQADSWTQPAPVETEPPLNAEGMPGMVGCNQLSFAPSIAVAPDGQEASTPTALNVGVDVPQGLSLDPEGLAEADVKDTTVTLPAGVQLSPSAADGLQACSNAQIGFTGPKELNPTSEPGVQTPQFKPTAPSCPEASKVATVKIKTPLLPNELTGAVYLASPQNFAGLAQNPFETLVAMYLVAEDPVSGTLVKLPGKVSPDPVTGQLVATFADTPQLPFENLQLEFFGSDRAPLSTPALCGTYTTTTSITSWSGSEAAPSTSFPITTGPDGSGPAGCSSPRQFAPGFNAQSTNIQAGAFTPFTLTMSRPDQDQTLGRIEMTMPPGLSATLSSVKLCPEPQASQGTCGPESLVGETVVSAGLGNDPYTVTGGKVYITTAYGGGQYGLSIVNPAQAGPFVLDEGHPVIVRAAIYVDPHTAALKIVSNPLPTILDGIPLQIQHVNVSINRPGFTFNPTSCNKTAVNGTLASSEGATTAVSTPFQVTNCTTLKFEPKISVSTQGHTSKADGASLTYKIAYPNVPQGTDADIRYVKVELPGELPSRLTTLQKACTSNQFDANPAGCPKESVIGHGKAVVPNIPVPLEGPVYFVSNGGEAFPNLVMVLQGYGVTIELVGDTLIKNGVTSTTFNQVPDNPVTSFEINLPEGKYSALAANGNLCKPTKTETVKKKVKVEVKGHEKTLTRKVKEQISTSLTIPSDYIAQNGATYKVDAPVSVTGCPHARAKAKPAKKAKKKAKGKKKATKK